MTDRQLSDMADPFARQAVGSILERHREDALSRARLAIIEQLRCGEPHTHGFLVTIGRRAALDWLRVETGYNRKQRPDLTQLHAGLADPAAAPPFVPLSRREQLSRLAARINALPDPDRSIAASVYFAGETALAVGERLRLTEAAVWQRLAKIRRKLSEEAAA